MQAGSTTERDDRSRVFVISLPILNNLLESTAIKEGSTAILFSAILIPPDVCFGPVVRIEFLSRFLPDVYIKDVCALL